MNCYLADETCQTFDNTHARLFTGLCRSCADLAEWCLQSHTEPADGSSNRHSCKLRFSRAPAHYFFSSTSHAARPAGFANSFARHAARFHRESRTGRCASCGSGTGARHDGLLHCAGVDAGVHARRGREIVKANNNARQRWNLKLDFVGANSEGQPVGGDLARTQVSDVSFHRDFRRLTALRYTGQAIDVFPSQPFS